MKSVSEVERAAPSLTVHALQTESRQQLLDLTPLVADAIAASGVADGLVGVYSQHTTAALFVGESQPALLDDVLQFLGRVADDRLDYKHNSPEFSDCDRRNATAHLRAMLLSHSVLVPVAGGRPVLGGFQRILLIELDGPRERTVQVQVLGA